MRLIPGVLASALLCACSSQLVVTPSTPDGTSTALDVTSKSGVFTLDRVDYGYYSDKVWDVAYHVRAEDIAREFGPGIEAMDTILAAGLPELPHSYLVLLRHESGPLGSLEFESTAGIRHQLHNNVEAVYIDGYPGGPRQLDSQRLARDFGPALAALRETLKARRSYLMLLTSPDGEASKVIFRAGDAEVSLDTPGESLNLDGLPYEAEQALADKDFAEPREATRQILEAGLPRIPHSFVALLESPRGPLGEVEILEGPAQGVILNQAQQAVAIDGYSRKPFTLDRDSYQTSFGEALEAMPPLPETLILYFESGSTRLTPAGKSILPRILGEIGKRHNAEVAIHGHTDRVSDDSSNMRLSRQRGAMVAAYIRNSGLPVREIDIESFGENLPAVATSDNAPEAMNRRVEVTIR